MCARQNPVSGRGLARQRGQAMLLTAVMILFGVSAIILTTTSSTALSIANRQAADTDQSMAQVKAALLAWSAARGPTAASVNRRPGELPCPDNDNSGTDAGSCAAGAIGRVPWKSLGIPEPRDSTGETLWYAIAGPFRNYNMSSSPITSNTQGNLTVYGGSSTTTITSQAVAVIFAPGSALNAQDRSSSASSACATTGTTIANNLCATNYLESAGGGNNAQTGGPFIQAQSSSTFNDRALAITNEDLMPLVEQRVAREMVALLNQYRAATATSATYPAGVYPWAALASGDSTAGNNRNRFPCGSALPVDWGSVPSGGTTATPTLPNWLTNGCATTGWASVVYYAAASARLDTTTTACSTCTASSLAVTNTGSLPATQCSTGSTPACAPSAISTGTADVLLLTAGGFTGSPTRNWPSDLVTAITGYFEDGDNSGNNDDSYVVPTSTTSNNRDRLYIIR